jgi:hypothetical protein
MEDRREVMCRARIILVGILAFPFRKSPQVKGSFRRWFVLCIYCYENKNSYSTSFLVVRSSLRSGISLAQYISTQIFKCVERSTASTPGAAHLVPIHPHSF